MSADTPDFDAAAKAVNSHKPRVNPSGNVDPLAEQSTSTTKQEGSDKGASTLSDGTSFEAAHAEGDSPVHRHVHLAHGTKEQEELEERIKLTLGGKAD